MNFILSILSRFISIFALPVTKTEDEEFNELKALIKNGDCLVSRTKWELSNVFMPGTWKHAAIYLDGFVWEAVTSGVRKTSLEEFFYKKDYIGLCRFKEPVGSQVGDGLSFLKVRLGKPYDWEFSLSGSEKYYCSELCYLFYSYLFVDFKLKFKVSRYFNQDIIRPTDMWKNLSQIGRW